ncbi:MAG: hypothetical protein JOS17DRAFT_726954 [Linnemannia elongata]|nr:MAG: hypothetical protein JOS17DRAFT_726954 [Linnemannia elongata]
MGKIINDRLGPMLVRPPTHLGTHLSSSLLAAISTSHSLFLFLPSFPFIFTSFLSSLSSFFFLQLLSLSFLFFIPSSLLVRQTFRLCVSFPEHFLDSTPPFPSLLYSAIILSLHLSYPSNSTSSISSTTFSRRSFVTTQHPVTLP